MNQPLRREGEARPSDMRVIASRGPTVEVANGLQFLLRRLLLYIQEWRPSPLLRGEGKARTSLYEGRRRLRLALTKEGGCKA